MLEVQNISFSYQELPVLQGLDFTVKKGQHLSVIGESGCGKSTLLKLIYGLLQPLEGSVSWNDQKVLGPNYNLIPGASFMKYLAQDFDLMPYISVSENIGKFLSNFYPEKKKQRIEELLQLVEMTAFADTHARYLSGGQLQRVALARALAKEPELILLDEPFTNIDAFRKNKLRRDLFSYFKEKGISCIVATHDPEDFLSYSDEVLVLKNGKMVRKDTPVRLHQDPGHMYTASLFGEVNHLPERFFFHNSPNNQKILVYPHEMVVVPDGTLEATVLKGYFKGCTWFYKAQHLEHELFFEHAVPLAEGSVVTLRLKEGVPARMISS